MNNTIPNATNNKSSSYTIVILTFLTFLLFVSLFIPSFTIKSLFFRYFTTASTVGFSNTMWNSSYFASKDVMNYLQNYPKQVQKRSANDNLLFYSNKLQSKPYGEHIDVMHKTWFGKYDLLERHHGYIQWLFPLRESGLNSAAQILYLHEIKEMKSDNTILNRIRKSYELMLDFYGMKLINTTTGQIARSQNYKDRYKNLNTSSHNYLRITRVLKSLGELSYEHYKFPFCLFIITELKQNQLGRVQSSALNYWFPVLRSSANKQLLQQIIKEKKREYSEQEIAEIIKEAAEQRKAEEEEAKQKLTANEEEKKQDDEADNVVTKPSQKRRLSLSSSSDASDTSADESENDNSPELAVSSEDENEHKAESSAPSTHSSPVKQPTLTNKLKQSAIESHFKTKEKEDL